ncbi:MAG: TRAP transporter small permease [Syntrophobacteraceae bacterium]
MIAAGNRGDAAPRHLAVVAAVSDGVDGVVKGTLCAIGAGMALLIGIQVFSRYILNHSLFWAEEVGRMCLVWITFLGATAAYRRHHHVGIDILVRRLPERIQLLSGMLAWSTSMLLFGVMVVYGFRFVGFVAHQKTAALGLPMALPYSVIPVSGVVFLLHGIRHLLEQIQRDGGK